MHGNPHGAIIISVSIHSLAMPVVDLTFGLNGHTIPADHGYSLFSAICRLVPSVHSDETIGIHPISGRPVGRREICLTPNSSLSFRIPSENIRMFLPLSGKILDLDGHKIQIGVPKTHALRPSPVLGSRLVVIKGFTSPDGFMEAAKRQLAELRISGEPSLVPRSLSRSVEGMKGAALGSPYIRRTLQVQGYTIVGFAVRIERINPADSIRLQEIGIGGRRRFGCGILIPQRGLTS